MGGRVYKCVTALGDPFWRGGAGYYAGNDQGELLHFYVTPAFEREARALFDHVISQDSLTQAVVSTIDPSYLSLCLDVQDKVIPGRVSSMSGSWSRQRTVGRDGRPISSCAEGAQCDLLNDGGECGGAESHHANWLRQPSSNHECLSSVRVARRRPATAR